MKAHLKSRTGRLMVEVEAPTVKLLFKQLAEAQSVLDADSACGACNSTNIRFRVRTHEGNDYYELACDDCGANLSFGQHRSGESLFPKRRNDEGALPNSGWTKYLPKQQQPEPGTRRPNPRASS